MIGIGKNQQNNKIKEVMASCTLLNNISIGELTVTIVLENNVLYLYSHKGINQSNIELIGVQYRSSVCHAKSFQHVCK